MSIVFALLILVISAVLINMAVPGGLGSPPGLIAFIVVALLVVGGGYVGRIYG